MPIRTRDLCYESLTFAVAERLLPSFISSGRFAPPRQFRGRHTIDEEIKMLSHYALCEGPLYAQYRSWEQAFRLISGFTKGGPSRLERRWWLLPRLLGPIDGITPPDVLAQLHAALLRYGFQVIDCNDVTFTAAFTSADTCTVMDLPEPYGKWHQIQENRPRWKREMDLETDLVFEVRSVDRATGSAVGFDSFVSIKMSSLAAPLLIAVEQELASLLNVDCVAPTDFRRNLVASLKHEIARL